MDFRFHILSPARQRFPRTGISNEQVTTVFELGTASPLLMRILLLFKSTDAGDMDLDIIHLCNLFATKMVKLKYVV